MASRQNKAKSTFQVPDYSKTRVYTGSLDALGEVGFATVAEFVSAVNDRLVVTGLLPISCGDYPTSEKKLRRLIKRWSGIAQSEAAAPGANVHAAVSVFLRGRGGEKAKADTQDYAFEMNAIENRQREAADLSQQL